MGYFYRVDVVLVFMWLLLNCGFSDKSLKFWVIYIGFIFWYFFKENRLWYFLLRKFLVRRFFFLILFLWGKKYGRDYIDDLVLVDFLFAFIFFKDYSSENKRILILF